MPYLLELSLEAIRNLDKLDPLMLQRLTLKINWLANNFESVIPEPLSGKLKGFFRFRIGDYRAIYSLDNTNAKIIILAVGHRSVVYRDR
jgi:mRNA interferase RelE/StbE